MNWQRQSAAIALPYLLILQKSQTSCRKFLMAPHCELLPGDLQIFYHPIKQFDLPVPKSSKLHGQLRSQDSKHLLQHHFWHLIYKQNHHKSYSGCTFHLAPSQCPLNSNVGARPPWSIAYRVLQRKAHVSLQDTEKERCAYYRKYSGHHRERDITLLRRSNTVLNHRM